MNGMSPKMAADDSTMMRLDVALVERGLVDSRSKATRLVKEGRVSLNGRIVTKPATVVPKDAALNVDKGEDYVSRGALKLVGAFEAFARDGLVDPTDCDCLDVGASTGGFTEVLLRRGARRVVALDVGHDQLAPRIAADPRVIDMSGVNIRDVEKDDLPFAPLFVVSDVSFISLTFVLPVIARLAAPGAHIVLLVKPQFEVGRGHLGKNGVVTDEQARRHALETVADSAAREGLTVVANAPSPIEGMHGNRETLLYVRA